MSHLRAIAIAAAVSATAAVAATVPAQAHAPVASAAKSCSLSSRESGGSSGGSSFGPSYVTSLKVSGTSCTAGKSLVRAYYLCRIRNGGWKGHCAGVSGYHCSERRQGLSYTFNAVATCTKGGRRVVHSYQQNRP